MMACLRMRGMIDASATISCSRPRTFNLASTTDIASLPIFAVQLMWK